MFEKHFALTRNPFHKSIAPDELYDFTGHKELRARIAHLLELRGIGLCTGEPGCGKTTAARRIAATLHTSLYRVLYVPLTTGNVIDMYKSIAWALGLPTERSRAALYRAVRGEITRLCLENKLRPVLIIDEAHHLRSEVLEDLRILTNYQMDSDNRLCLLLIGRGELRRRLGMAVHEPLAQRIVMAYHLDGMTRDELEPYLSHLLRLAGRETAVFTPPALEAMFQQTKGVPRRINLLAQHALTASALEHGHEVTEEHVRRACEELV